MDKILCLIHDDGNYYHFEGSHKTIPTKLANESLNYFVISEFNNKKNIELFEGDLRDNWPESDVICHFYTKSINQSFFNSHDTKSSDFKDWVNEAKELFQTGELQKVVLSAIKKIPWKAEPEKIIYAFRQLIHQNPEAFACLIFSEIFGIWIGLSPEFLVRLENGFITSMSLAGTREVREDNWTSEEVWGYKELEEQAIVTKYIEDFLIKKGTKGLRISGPYTFRNGLIEHLRTDFSGQLPSYRRNEILLHALELHPTPAVCGTPVEISKNFILTHEKHTRELFTGFWGFVSSKITKLYVNIRCFKVLPEEVLLYAGAGITPLSNSDEEWLEIRRKMRVSASVLQRT